MATANPEKTQPPVVPANGNPLDLVKLDDLTGPELLKMAQLLTGDQIDATKVNIDPKKATTSSFS